MTGYGVNAQLWLGHEPGWLHGANIWLLAMLIVALGAAIFLGIGWLRRRRKGGTSGGSGSGSGDWEISGGTPPPAYDPSEQGERVAADPKTIGWPTAIGVAATLVSDRDRDERGGVLVAVDLRQRRGELDPRADAQLAVGGVELGLDRAAGDEERLGDLAVAHPARPPSRRRGARRR